MGLLNYTTTIDVHKTLGEIQKILVEHGARKLMYDYDENGHIQSLCFSILTSGENERAIRLPANVQAIYKVLQVQKNQKKINIKPDYAQAERVAWRIIKDWVEAQMAILETQMVQAEEIFLPYMVNKDGNTFFQVYQQGKLMLMDGEG